MWITLPRWTPSQRFDPAPKSITLGDSYANSLNIRQDVQVIHWLNLINAEFDMKSFASCLLLDALRVERYLILAQSIVPNEICIFNKNDSLLIRCWLRLGDIAV